MPVNVRERSPASTGSCEIHALVPVKPARTGLRRRWSLCGALMLLRCSASSPRDQRPSTISRSPPLLGWPRPPSPGVTQELTTLISRTTPSTISVCPLISIGNWSRAKDPWRGVPIRVHAFSKPKARRLPSVTIVNFVPRRMIWAADRVPFRGHGLIAHPPNSERPRR